MNQTIASKLLRDEVEKLKRRSYGFLAQSINRTTHKEALGPDGIAYQIEVEVFWESRRGGNIRVLGTVDNKQARSQNPLTEDFIITPAGTFLVA